MTSLKSLIAGAARKEDFTSLTKYIDFSLKFLEYIEVHRQAVIVARNDHRYAFFQFNKDADYKVTRPYNSELLYTISEAKERYEEFRTVLHELLEFRGEAVIADSTVINRAVYTIQQSIGFALDAGTTRGVEPNTARKINGDLFERLVYLLLKDIGVSCRSGVVNIPVKVDGHEQFKFTYQHDLIIEQDDVLKVVGSVKTSSKDRMDKIFIDKFLYCKLTETSVPHIAVFLHDVQRTKTKKENEFGVGATFLPGRFKGYTVRLNPLDGVYYLDLRPNMRTDSILREQIRDFHELVCSDIWMHLL